MIWQHSMSTGTVPKFYKTSNIAPLHKKGSRAIAGNYRPVSLTSHIIKIYERVLRKLMVAHLEENNLLNSKQHGFRSGKSCLTQLFHHFDDIIEALSNGEDMDAIYSKTPIYRGVWGQGNIRIKSGSAVNQGFVWFTLCMFSPIWGKGNGRGISGFAVNRGFTVLGLCQGF